MWRFLKIKLDTSLTPALGLRMKSIPESCDIPSLSRVRDFFNMEFCGL
jgi:hypothetical protein